MILAFHFLHDQDDDGTEDTVQLYILSHQSGHSVYVHQSGHGGHEALVTPLLASELF